MLRPASETAVVGIDAAELALLLSSVSLASANFYTKVLTKFASLPDLRLEVSFQVPLEPDQADAKADEARSGLKELGLDDNVGLT